MNNAMTTVFSRFVEITPEEFRRATDVTYHGTVYGTMSALRRMWPRNVGRSCRWVRRSPIEGFRSKLRTAGQARRPGIH